MALSIETIHGYADVCTPNTETGSLNYIAFARAIESEARKQDEALILMLVERLERADKISGHANNKAAINAGRARLEGTHEHRTNQS